MKKWKILESQTVLKNQWFDIKEHKVQISDTLALEGVVILDFPDWVNIIALDEKRQVVLERNYRHARGQVFIETPSGSMESTDKTSLDAARRELLEETGYASDQFVLLGVSETNPQLLTNRMHHFLALDCRWVQKPQAEFEGVVESWLEPWNQVIGRLDKGEISNSLAVEGLLRAERYLKSKFPKEFK
jgi:8-oxo-dGTP pyrophosphatase MutT (NUDIX family)